MAFAVMAGRAGQAVLPRRRGSAAALLTVAVLIAAMPLAVSAAATEIIVKGNRLIDAQTIRSHLELRPGAAPDAAALDAALKDLYATGAFENVEITRAGNQVIVTVAEAPVIDRLRFEGNRKLKDEDLARVVRLKARSPMTRAAVQSDVASLVALYRRNGRYAVEIRPRTIARGEGRVDLVLEIEEGAKTGIGRIVFTGNHAFTGQRLKAVITTTESGWLGFLKTSDVFDQARVDADSEQLRRFYARNGFADARVISAVGSWDEALRGVVLTFTLEEGPRYRFGKVGIESRVAAVDLATLQPHVEPSGGDVYNGDAVERTVEALALALGRSGYPFLSVRPQLLRDSRRRTVDLVLALEERPHQYVERIVVRGNAATREEVVRREIDIGEGDPFNRALVERAERRLRSLGLFKSVRIATGPGAAPDRLVLTVQVEEQKTGDFAFSGGYSTVDGLLGEVSISEANFLGRGQYVKIAATLGQYLRGGALNVVEPNIFGSRAALGVDLSFRESLTNVNQSYGSSTYRAAVRLTAPLTDTLGGETRYALSRKTFSLAPALMDCSAGSPPPACYANGEASAAVKQAALDGPTWISTAGSTLTYSTLDNPRNPHEGMRGSISQDVAGLGGGVKFMRSITDVHAYRSLGDEMVGMARVQGGVITPLGGQPLPLAASFFGGPHLVRGFAPNGFGPRDLTPGTTMDNIGGSLYWATTAQLQAPIPGLPPEAALRVGVFADAGSLWGYRGATSFPNLSQSLNPSDSSKLRSSVGASLIWDSPLGPLHVDYAVPLSKAGTDVTRRLNFGAGLF